MTAPVDVSVVICTCNRAEMLRESLDSLIAQQTDGLFDYEIVVVDNASTDRTSDIVAEVAARALMPVRHVYEPQQGHVYARNRGVREARGAWIASFDDDQTADPSWLRELVALAQRTGARSVGGAIDLLLPDGCTRRLAPVVRRTLGESLGWDSPRRYRVTNGPGAGNQMLHRSVFDEVGMYDASYNLRGEDVDLYRRMRQAGIDSWYAPNAVGHHMVPPVRLTEDYLRRTSLHNGWCFARRDRKEHGQFGLAARLVARTGQALLMHLPRWGAAKLRGDAENVLGMRCLLWKFKGYLLGAVPSWMPPSMGTAAGHDALAAQTRHETLKDFQAVG